MMFGIKDFKNRENLLEVRLHDIFQQNSSERSRYFLAVSISAEIKKFLRNVWLINPLAFLSAKSFGFLMLGKRVICFIKENFHGNKQAV